ncbi:MFS transporter [Streptomyces sp. NBC_00233]|uniref:MFS transporter n=1 Tax=Streptomyces sp. NBC_00233 TaxID=2975686 RepID=UPI00225606CC|nr:MFS transporter [Streptomyces sp. NBC_00233]MCX5226880.1 MFS transporter [Streptomyces sp. NBC_00233]
MPPPGAARTLAAAQLSNSIGDGLYYTCSALYFTHVVGLPATRLGLGLTLAWAVGSLAGVPLGHLADRRGPRNLAVLLSLVTAAVVATFLVIDSFVPFVLVTCLYATVQSGLAAVRQALLADLVAPAERTGVLAHLQSTLNAGLAVGAALGGLALSNGTRPAYLAVFAVDALGFLLAALILLRLPAPRTTARAAAHRREDGTEPRLAVLHDRPYVLLMLINTVLLLRLPLLSLALPLWIATRFPGLTWLASVLFVLNTGAVMLFQVRTARAVTDLPSAARLVRHAGGILLVSCAVFAASAARLPAWATVAILLAGAVLQVIGEMQHSAGAWHIGFDLAPPHRIGQYQGFFGTGVAVARTLGPTLVTVLLVTWGVPGWLLLGALFLGAGYAMAPATRWAERTRPVRSIGVNVPSGVSSN